MQSLKFKSLNFPESVPSNRKRKFCSHNFANVRSINMITNDRNVLKTTQSNSAFQPKFIADHLFIYDKLIRKSTDTHSQKLVAIIYLPDIIICTVRLWVCLLAYYL